MRRRWSGANGAALGLSLLTLGTAAPSAGEGVQAAGRPFACSPTAKPANLNFALKNFENVDVKLSALRDCKEITACTIDRRVVRCARGGGHPAGKACSAGARAHGAIAPGVGGD